MRSPVDAALALRTEVREGNDVRQLVAAEMVHLVLGAPTLAGWRVFEETEFSAGEIRLRRVLLGQFLRVKQELIQAEDRGDAPVAFLSVGEYISSERPIAIFADGEWRWVSSAYFKMYAQFVG